MIQSNRLRARLRERALILDGAMGTMLQRAGLPAGAPPELFNLTHPDAVLAVHRAYLAAGSDMILTNTFGAYERKLPPEYSVEAVVTAGVALARRAVEETGREGYVALDLSSLGELLEPGGTLSFDTAYAAFARAVRAGVEAGADAVYIETMSDLREMKCAVMAARDQTDLPVFCTMSFEASGRTFLGVSVAAMAVTMDAMGADALGVNCSVGPAQLPGMLAELQMYTDKPLILKPNAGLPVLRDGQTCFDVTPAEFAKGLSALWGTGVAAVGGCCGTTPEHIAELSAVLSGRAVQPSPERRCATVSSARRALRLDRVYIIGERINPTGQPELIRALTDGDYDEIAELAEEQIEGGAELLDINAAVPGLDEPRIMGELIAALQPTVHTPLLIDSADPAALEAGLRAYIGKPVLNSIDARQASLDTLLPLARRYGAAIVAMPMDEGGLPADTERRMELLHRIIEAARSYGIPACDILCDALTLPSATAQAQTRHTLETLRRCRAEGMTTIAGISNISFGLPARSQLNAAFFALALASGLTLPMADVTDPVMRDFMAAAHQLMAPNAEVEDYIERFMR